jgi:HAD superfamily hydrolase (TIGR01509 family)
MIKALIFDFAGVIGADGYWLWLKENVPDIEHHKEVFHEISIRADRGEISADDFMRFVGDRTGYDPEVILSGFLKKVEINQPLVNLIEKLKPDYKIGLLSNFVFEWLNKILTTNDLYRLFDSAIISSRSKMVKPDKEIFELSCKELGVLPEEAIFIDDRIGHVDASISFGLKGILYTDLSSLSKKFVELGVLKKYAEQLN